MLDPGKIPLAEIRHRRPTWTCGRATYLADGQPWRLPTISQSLLATTSGLGADIAEVVRIAREGRDARARSLDPPCFHAQLASVGFRLLRANYDLADEDWVFLLDFKTKPDLLAFTGNVSCTLELARPVWRPFLQASDSDGVLPLFPN